MEYKEAYWYPEAGASRFYRRWSPPVQGQAAVVIFHGYGEYGGRYRELAAALTSAGCTVWAPDLYGHGYSDGLRAFVPKLEHLAEEQHRFISSVVRPVTDVPLFLMGHSMGGGLALLYALRHQDVLKGLILSGAAVRLGDGASLLRRIAARVAATVAPKLPLMPFGNDDISRRPEVVEHYRKDPLVYTGKIRAYTGLQLLRFERLLSPENLAALSLPVLIYHGGSDRIVPPSSSRYLYRHIGSEESTLREFPAAYHEAHHEPEREELYALLSGWIGQHCSGSTGQ